MKGIIDGMGNIMEFSTEEDSLDPFCFVDVSSSQMSGVLGTVCKLLEGKGGSSVTVNPLFYWKLKIYVNFCFACFKCWNDQCQYSFLSDYNQDFYK